MRESCARPLPVYGKREGPMPSFISIGPELIQILRSVTLPAQPDSQILTRQSCRPYGALAQASTNTLQTRKAPNLGLGQCPVVHTHIVNRPGKELLLGRARGITMVCYGSDQSIVLGRA